jgi:hypothetical protein
MSECNFVKNRNYSLITRNEENFKNINLKISILINYTKFPDAVMNIVIGVVIFKVFYV